MRTTPTFTLLHWIIFSCAFLVPLIVGQLIDLQQVSWKSLEIIAIIFGGLGIVSAIGEAGRIFPANQNPYLKRRVGSARRAFRHIAANYIEIIQKRIEHLKDTKRASELQEFELALPWFENMLHQIEATTEQEFPSLADLIENFPPRVTDREILFLRDAVIGSADNYQVSLRSFEANTDALSATMLEEIVAFFSPYLITIAVGCTFFKAVFQP